MPFRRGFDIGRGIWQAERSGERGAPGEPGCGAGPRGREPGSPGPLLLPRSPPPRLAEPRQPRHPAGSYLGRVEGGQQGQQQEPGNAAGRPHPGAGAASPRLARLAEPLPHAAPTAGTAPPAGARVEAAAAAARGTLIPRAGEDGAARGAGAGPLPCPGPPSARPGPPLRQTSGPGGGGADATSWLPPARCPPALRRPLAGRLLRTRGRYRAPPAGTARCTRWSTGCRRGQATPACTLGSGGAPPARTQWSLCTVPLPQLQEGEQPRLRAAFLRLPPHS